MHGSVAATLKSSVKVEDPYPLSFQLSFRGSGGRSTCQIIREYFANGIDTGDIKIKDQAVKASIGVSAEKRGAFKAPYEALERVNSTLDASKVEVCKRRCPACAASAAESLNAARPSPRTM